METQPEPTLAEVAVAQVDDRALPRVHAAQAVERSTARQHRREQPQLGEHRQARRLQDDPRADRSRLGDPLVERDPMALAREEQRGGLSGGATPHDARVERLHADDLSPA